LSKERFVESERSSDQASSVSDDSLSIASSFAWGDPHLEKVNITLILIELKLTIFVGSFVHG
jgi:hypothetical protein